MAGHIVGNFGSRAPHAVARRELPYVLIADRDTRRIQACIEAITPYRHGALVAANAEEAQRILDRFGAPLILFADILLPPQDGFSLIETVRRLETGKTGIVAWASTRALREFAICRLAGLHVRVLGGSPSPAVIRSVVDHLLSGTPAPRDASTGTTEPAQPSAAEDLVDWLQTRAREICGTPGIAVYLRDGDGSAFRSSGSWTPDEPMPQSLDYLPYALNRVMETHEPFVSLDVSGEGAGRPVDHQAPGGLRGIVAVPIFGSDAESVVGMICAFDVKPLALEGRRIEALAELGRTANAPPAATPPANRFVVKRGRSPEPAPDDGALGEAATHTTLLDRETGTAAVARELARVRREQYPLSVVLFDVDAKDRQTPLAAGAAPVDAVGSTLTRVVRGSDLAIRWGGRELLLVLPGIHSADARRVADRVRHAAHAGIGDRVAIAEGVAELGSDSWESTLARATDDMRGADAAPAGGPD